MVLLLQTTITADTDATATAFENDVPQNITSIIGIQQFDKPTVSKRCIRSIYIYICFIIFIRVFFLLARIFIFHSR